MNNYYSDASDEFNARLGLSKITAICQTRESLEKSLLYRTEFKIPDNIKGSKLWLNLMHKLIGGSLDKWKANFHIQMKWQECSTDLNIILLNFVKSDETNFLAVKIFPLDNPGKPGTQFQPFGGSRDLAEEIF